MASDLTGRWKIEPRSGQLDVQTGRVGPLSFSARAPIEGGEVHWDPARVQLQLLIAIGELKTGSRLLDLEARGLVRRGSDGILTYLGAGQPVEEEIDFAGEAKSGNVLVPMSLRGTAEPDSADRAWLDISGIATFNDVHIPLPGLSGIRRIEVKVSGRLQLVLHPAGT